MKNAIITFADWTCDKFLVDHWLSSLQANVNIPNLDIVILDYGITKKQSLKIKKMKKTILYKCLRNGKVVIIRFRDLVHFLQNKKYDQVMLTDGGDIIFQKDLSKLFEKDKTKFRAVREDYYSAMGKIWMRDAFTPEDAKKINKNLKNYVKKLMS